MKKFLSLVLALVMTMSLVTVSAGAKDFTDSEDLSGEAYAEAVNVMSEMGIIDGYAGGAFQPQGTLTRGAAAKIIACMMLGKTTAEALGTQAAPFKDVPVGSTFAGYIAYCVEAGLIDGYADGTFRPQNTLTGFAFLKMLLTALGYDSAVEGFTGSNWTVNVARRAIENGLTDGNDNFVGTRAATREEACLYAVNTIKATLVEYANKGSSITINGAEIVTGASAPTVVTSGNANQATSINSDVYTGTVSGSSASRYYTVEFGERYMPRLSLKGTTDDFMRPAHVWDYEGEEIGVYTDEPDLTYTTKVTANDIYDDLGLTSTVVADVYEDGLQIADFTVKNNDINTKIGANGVLTQVFEDGYWDDGKWVTTVTITKVNTYVGDVVSKVAATSVRDAYVIVAARGEKGYLGGNYTTDDFAVDDVVIYNYSYKSGASGVKNVAAAETLDGTLNSFTSGESATVSDKEYDYSYKIANEAANAAVNTTVTVVLDSYGYAIDIEGSDAVYAVVLDINDPGDLRHEARLLFTDGSEELVTTFADYASVGGVDAGDIVSYTIRSNDRYVLNTVADGTAQTAGITNGQYSFVVNGTYSSGSWSGGTPYYANGDTIFLVKDADANGNPMYSAYQGIKNVPSITKTSTTTGVYVAVFCENATSYLADVVYVDASETSTSVLNPASDVIFVKGNNNGDSYTHGIGSYHRYVAVVNGELREGADQLMTATGYDVTYGLTAGHYGLFDGVNYDANGVATLNRTNVVAGVGVYKESNDVLGYYAQDTNFDGVADGSYHYYPVEDNAFVVIVDEDGNITTGQTIASVVKDNNDLVWFKLNTSGAVASAYIVKVAGGEVDVDTYAVNGSTGVSFSTTIDSGYASNIANVEVGDTVYVQPSSGYAVDAAATATAGGVTLTATGVDGIYSFVMPARAIALEEIKTTVLPVLSIVATGGTALVTINGESKTIGAIPTTITMAPTDTVDIVVTAVSGSNTKGNTTATLTSGGTNAILWNTSEGTVKSWTVSGMTANDTLTLALS